MPGRAVAVDILQNEEVERPDQPAVDVRTRIVRDLLREPDRIAVVAVFDFRLVVSAIGAAKRFADLLFRHRVALDAGGHVGATGLREPAEPAREHRRYVERLDLLTSVIEIGDERLQRFVVDGGCE